MTASSIRPGSSERAFILHDAAPTFSLAGQQGRDEASEILTRISEETCLNRIRRNLFLIISRISWLIAPPLARVAIWTICTIPAASLPPDILAWFLASFWVTHSPN